MTVAAQPIIITGFMAAGKTAVADSLARLLACAMIDLDKFVEAHDGRTPQRIIDEDGEQPFREIEAEALRDALERGGARIIALGGGTWTVPDNRALIREHGALTVWLDAPFELCWQRIMSEHNSRPLARDFERARRLYDERRAVYDQVLLHIEVSAEKSADAIAAEIAEALLLRLEEETEQGKS